MFRVNIEKKFFNKFDEFLNKLDIPENYLKNPKCADVVVEKLEKYDNKHYELLAYCIMPTHVHILIDTAIQKQKLGENEEFNKNNYVPIGKIMQLIKGASSYEINIILKRNGTLWLRDYWDHYIRNDKEFGRVVDYIKLNPVKPGLVDDWTKWKYMFISEKCK